MAIYRKGADPAALRASAERLTAHARECDAVRSEAGRALGSLKGHWGGGDLEHLMTRWPPLEAQLTQFGSDLGRLAEALRRNAGAQDSTSGQGGTSSTLPLAFAGAGAPGGSGGSPVSEVPRGSREREGEGAREDRERTTVDRRGSGGEGSEGTEGGDPHHGGLGDPVPGTSLPSSPQPPQWQAPDEGAGEYDSEWASPKDYGTKWAAEAGANALAGSWPDASRNLLHYLANDGEPLTQDVDRMLEDCDDLRGDVDAQTDALARQAVDQARQGGVTGPVTFPVNTPWAGHYIGKEESANWFYASGGMAYNQTGSITVYPPDTPGGAWRYESDTQVNYRDQYNWDGGKSTDIGPITVTDAQLAELHRAGLAREYTMEGTSSSRTTSGEIT